jgi:hypothetical protein
MTVKGPRASRPLMFERNRAVLLRPSRWISLLRKLVNAWHVLFLCLAVVLLLIALFRVDVEEGGFLHFILWAWSRGLFVLAVLSWPGWFAFKLGVVSCPCCGESFAEKAGFSFLVEPRCVNCGYDPSTISRRGDF